MSPGMQDVRGALDPPSVGTARSLFVPFALAALALVICVTFAHFADPIPLTDDSLTYFKIAENVSYGKGFTDDGIRPHFYRPPLFSSMLGGWFFITGSRTLIAVRLYQSLCIAASVFFAYFLFLELMPAFRGRSAAVATAWVAVQPSLWTQTAFTLQEPTILLVTTIACWLTLRWFRFPGKARAALAGASWGIATLAKAVTLFVPLLLPIFWFLVRKKDWRVPFPEIALSVFTFFLAIAPWTARNYYHLHRLVPVNDQGLGMLEWNVQHSDAPVDEGKNSVALLLTLLQTKDATRGELDGEKFLAELDREGMSGKERKNELWAYILAHKKYFLLQRLANALLFAAPSAEWWIATGRLTTLLPEPYANLPYRGFALFLHAPFYLFLMGRIYRFLKGTLAPSFSFLVLLYIGYWSTYALFVGAPRFAVPVYPVLVAMAPWDRIFSKT